MDEFKPRAGVSSVDRATVRPAAPLKAMEPTSRRSLTVGADAGRAAAQPRDATGVDPDIASATQYAEVHARVSEILADLDSGVLNVADAAGAIQNMIPRPMVIVPPPPASREAVLHAEAVAKRIVERAANSGSAHARLARAAVEQILAP